MAGVSLETSKNLSKLKVKRLKSRRMNKYLIIILTLLNEARGHDREGKTGFYYSNDMYKTSTYVWIVMFIVLCLIRTVLIKHSIPLHYTCISVFAGILSALMVMGNAYLHQMLHDIAQVESFYCLYFYVPGVLFKTAFCMDIYVFTKSLGQILIIAVPIALLTGITLGCLIKVMFAPQWRMTLAITFGILCTPIYATQTERYLKELAIHMKHTGTLLDGEAIIAIVVCFITYYIYLGHGLGYLHLWYQYVIALSRIILMGLIIGGVCGWFGCFVLKKINSTQTGVLLFTFGLPFVTFSITEIYGGGSGVISVLILGIMMANERQSLTLETDKLLTEFWRIVDILLKCVISLSIGIAVLPSIKELDSENYVYGFVIYLLYYFLRFLLFLLFAPILGRIGYGMNLKTMVICVLGGLKSLFCCIFAMGLTNKAEILIEPHERLRFRFAMVAFYLLSYLINGMLTPLLLKVMGVVDIAMVKQLNMNNCIKHIFAKRERIINVLKMNRYLADANWPLIAEVTIMKHPDRVGAQADDEEEDFFIGYRYTFCADCKREVAEEPTPKEMEEMTKEAKLRILKAKKMTYIRHQENGMISKDSLRILLQAVELAMDSKEAVIEVDQLAGRFSKEGCCRRYIRTRLYSALHKKVETIRPPRTYWRRLCYKLIQKAVYEYFIYAIVFINSIIVLVDLFLEEDERTAIGFLLVEFFFLAIYIFEFAVAILAHSRNGICRDGFPNYFKSHWNKLDFTIILLFGTTLVMECLKELVSFKNTPAGIVHETLDIAKIILLFRLLNLCHKCYPRILRHLDSSMDANLAFTYELGKAYANGEEEVVKMIPQIVDHEKIQEELKQRMEYERVLITKLLGVVQKEKPWIAITVKTKQAIRTVTNNMKEAVMQLKVSGWTDNFEHKKLIRGIQEMYKYANDIKEVQPSSPDVIFKEVAWMANDESVFGFLFENVTVKSFAPGEIVFGEGKVADGIYVVVTGLFFLTYTPEEYFLKSLENFGILPIADYLSNTQYYENVTDYIVSGNCMGELSVLTGRSYNCTITAEAHSQVYVLSHGVIKKAMELSPDFINGLECRIWKAVSVRVAVSLLSAVPTYHSATMDQLKYTLERSFMPNLRYYKIFTVTDMIQDILIIEGVARDFHSRDLFLGPCYVPRTVQKLILPASSLIDIPISIETRLLIIPENGVDEFDVMLLAEETCEMVAAPSEFKCLQHTIQNISSRLRRRQRSHVTSSESGRRRRYGGASIGDMVSRYTTADTTVTDAKQSEMGSVFIDFDEKEVESHGYDRKNQNEK